VLGPDVSGLYEGMGNAPSFVRRVSMLNAYFLDRLRRSPDQSGLLHGFRPLLEGGPHAGVARIAKACRHEHASAQTKITGILGLPPSMLNRIARFQRALALGSRPNISWLEVAHAADYYDQMHMIRDFRAFADGPPTRAFASIDPHHLIKF